MPIVFSYAVLAHFIKQSLIFQDCFTAKGAIDHLLASEGAGQPLDDQLELQISPKSSTAPISRDHLLDSISFKTKANVCFEQLPIDTLFTELALGIFASVIDCIDCCDVLFGQFLWTVLVGMGLRAIVAHLKTVTSVL